MAERHERLGHAAGEAMIRTWTETIELNTHPWRASFERCEMQCAECGAWSDEDDWQCLGFDQVLDDDDPIYSGDDAVQCPRCETVQKSPRAQGN